MAVPFKMTTDRGIAVRTVNSGAPEAYIDEDGILVHLNEIDGVPFVISGLQPTMTITGGNLNRVEIHVTVGE